MCVSEKLKKNYFILPEIIIAFAIGIVHLVYGYKMTSFIIFDSNDLFDSSPLFDFSISDNCQGKSNISFHRWGGRAKTSIRSNRDFQYEKVDVAYDQTDIRKINGNYFCYKHISYKDLLNNGQIVKKYNLCPLKYKQNCGKIDTLEQELCIEENEKCPLYDLGIGNPPDKENYIYNEGYSNVYYNNEKYDKTNQKIIGRLILSEGIPCYNSTEKLWRKFSNVEAFTTHLSCEFEVLGKKMMIDICQKEPSVIRKYTKKI